MARALIIGGSLGGLFAGLLLRQAGWDGDGVRAQQPAISPAAASASARMSNYSTSCGGSASPSMNRSASRSPRAFASPATATVIARLPFDKSLTSWTLLYRALRRQLPDPCYRRGHAARRHRAACAAASARFLPMARAPRAICWSAPTGLHSTVRRAPSAARRRPMPAMSPGAASSTKFRAARRRGDIVRSYAFFLPPRDMVLSYGSRAPMTITGPDAGA